MQLFSRNKALVALSLGALAALGACGDDVTVTAPATQPVVVSVSPPSASMNIGESVNFAVQITGGSSSATPTLTACTSSNTAVATAAVSGSACRVTAVAAGNATITAAASTGQIAAASVTVNAQAAAISGLSVSPTAAQIAVGQTVTVTPTVTRASSAVTVANAFSTSNAAVATVNATTGVVTAVAPGTATITVNTTGTGAGFTSTTLTGAATVTVVALPSGITALNVQPTSIQMALGSTAQIAASAQQPTGAAAAVISYGSTVPGVATVNAQTGLVTAVAPGTAQITVTATSAANAQFGAATLTQLVAVTVSPSANVTIQTITQGPIATVYVDSTNTDGARFAGIVSSANAQVNQPIDITNVRDQIQVVANLQPNGQRVDSIVAFVANADGTGRRAAARQIFSNGTANAGDITLFVNTADFTANFTAGTADVFYPNGQKLISVSVFTTEGTTAREIQNAVNNRQTVNFNNVDGYAAQYVNPTRVATNTATGNGLNWWGGPGAEGQGSASIVPVFYSTGRSLTNLTLAMRQGVRYTISICDGSIAQSLGGRTGNGISTESYTAAPYRVTYNADLGRQVAAGSGSSTNWSSAGNGNIECRGYEHPAVTAQNVIGVVGATDNQNNGAPLVTFADGYRFSTAVARPVANRLDYQGPSTTTPDIQRASPAVTGWVNATFNFQSNTDASTDGGVGIGDNSRTWFFQGAGTSTAPACGDTLWVAMPNATGADIPECASNLIGGWDGTAGTTRAGSPYRAVYTEVDRLGNLRRSDKSAVFGVDRTAPLIRFSAASAADTVIYTGLDGSSVQFQAEFIDERAGFIDGSELNTIATVPAPTKSSTGALSVLGSTVRAQNHFASRAAGLLQSGAFTGFTGRSICVNPNALGTPQTSPTTGAVLTAGATFQTNPSCSMVSPTTAAFIGQTSDGFRIGHPANLQGAAGIYHYATLVRDRAGNLSETLRRRAAVDPSAPSVSDVQIPATISAAATPSFGVNAQDDVEIRAGTYYTSYPATGFIRYSQQLIDARFNDIVNSPIAGNQFALAAPGAPYVLGVATTFAAAPTVNTLMGLQAWDVANRFAFNSGNVNSQSIPTLNSFDAGTGGGYTAWTVLPSRAAGFNAPEGLKAQLIANTNVTNAAFVRVDFFRQAPAGDGFGTHWQYLGSATTAASADIGGTSTSTVTARAFTWTLPDAAYAGLPNDFSTRQSPAAFGDVIAAIGVRANGAGLLATAPIGGQGISVTVAGLPTGAAANVTITNGTFTQAVTGSGTVIVPTAGSYDVNAAAVTFNSVTYAPTVTSQTVSVASGTVTNVTVTYAIQATQINVTVNGLPTGVNGSFTITGVGTFSRPNGVHTINVPGAGSYTITSTNVSSGGLTFAPTVTGSPAAVTVGPTPAAATVAYANTTPFINLTVSAPVTLTPSVSTTCGANAAQGTTVLGSRVITTDGANLSCATTAAPVQVGSQWYIPTVTNSPANAATSSAPTTTVAYAAANSQITVNHTSIGTGTNNLPNGIPFTVRVTSSAFASTGGFQDFSGVTGTALVIPVPAGQTYNVSVATPLISGTQRWTVAASTDITATGGTNSGSSQLNANSAVRQGIVLASAPTAPADIQAVVNFIWTGPVANP